MNTFTLTLTVTTNGDPKEMGALIASYLTNPDTAFRDDYAPPSPDEVEYFGGRSDGYDGPFVLDVQVAL
jgi:hypothetical protein